MKIIKVKSLLAVFVMLWIYGTVNAQQEQISNRQLKFEVTDQLEDWRSSLEGIGVIKPKYVAKFTLRKDGRGLTHYERWETWLQDKDLFSDQQQAFIKQEQYFSRNSVANDLYQIYWFYSVSAEDARKMAERFIEQIDKAAYEDRQELEGHLSRCRIRFIDAEKRIPEVETEIKQAEEKIKSLGDQFNNRIELADQRINEYCKMVGLLKIDIAGYQARIEVIRKYLGRNANNAFRDKQMELEIELAGALARKTEIETQIKQANEYVQAVRTDEQLKKELQGLNNIISSSPRLIAEYEQVLANPPAEMVPV